MQELEVINVSNYSNILRVQKLESILGYVNKLKNLINAFDSNDYSEYEITDNSKEEIKEATIELMKLIENKKIYSDETLKLNAKFWQQLKKWDEYNKYHGHINSFISPAFLKKNYDWLLD